MTPERKVYRPQPGPQTELLANEADIILFGGSAGVGKTFGILLDQIWFHDIPKFTAATFRRNSTQIRSPGGLWSSSQEMFREFDGHSKEATLEWSFPSGAVYKFAHLEHESSVYSWQGSELCCEENTLIKMGDFSFKKLSEIKVGHEVLTLKGNKKVKFVSNRRLDKCINLKTNEFTQINNINHKILTKFGWISFFEVYRFYEFLLLLIFESRQSYFYSKYEQYFPLKFLELKQLLDNLFLDQKLESLVDLSILDHPILQEIFFCKEKLNQEIDFELSQSNNPKILQQILDLLFSEIFPQFLLLLEDTSFLYQFYGVNACVRSELKPEDFLNHYLKDFDQYDGLAQWVKDNALSFSLLLDGVVQQTQKDLLFCDKDKVRKCIHSELQYAHPYTLQERVSEDIQIYFDQIIFSFALESWVIDLTIEDENHYITQSGLVNKNCAIYFDELTHFTKFQFVYMLSRNRSTCGIKPFIKATTNPDADSWVRELVDWYIDPHTGIAIPDRSGVIRWFIVLDDTWIWANSVEELKQKYPNSFPKSFTFITGSVYDNKKLLDVNPEYLANLNALSRVERERLLHGNWNIKPAAGLFFRKSFFETVKVPPRRTKKVRYWDRAATKKNDTNDPDYTVGLKLEKDEDGIIYVTDMVRIQESPLKVQQAIKNCASQDGIETQIGIEQDPGQAGVSEVDYLLRQLAGFRVKAYKVSSDKVTRCLPASSQAEAGNIKILEAKWNEDFFKELENFPEAKHDDIVDALSGAFGMFTESTYNISSMTL